jgi:hypothetical protein
MTTVTGPSTTPTYGQTVTFTATVTDTNPSGGTPTGSVEFYYDTTNNGVTTKTDLGPGSAITGSGNTVTSTFSIATLPAGTDTIEADYTPSGAFQATSGTLSQTVDKDATTTVVSALSTTSFGQADTLTATVTANLPGSGTPTGTVTFVDATTGNTVGTATLTDGTASVAVSDLPPGAGTIMASYGGDGNFLASPSAVGSTVTVIGSVIVLDSQASGALDVGGSAIVNTPGLLQVDSSSTSALVAGGSARVEAGTIQVVGGVSVSGGASLSPKPDTGATALADPLAGLPVPAQGPSLGPVNLSGSQTLTIGPGFYTAINLSGTARLTMDPGIYEIGYGGFNVGGSAQVTGSGVVLVNTGGGDPTRKRGSYGAINFGGDAVVQLSAPSTGTYAGIVIFQPGANTQTLTLGRSAAPDLNGLVYAPSALVSVSGSVSLEQTTLVVEELVVAGSGSAVPYSTPSKTSVVPAAAIAAAGGTPEGPLGLAASPPSVAPATGSRPTAVARPVGVTSTAAATSLAASSRPVAMGLAGGSEEPDSSLLEDSELLADVAVSLIAGQRGGIADSAPARSKARA